MDRDAELRAICEREYPRLVGVLSLYLGSLSIAEDLAQETLLRLCSRWPRLERIRNPSAWLAVAAINVANSWGRRRKAEAAALRRLTSETSDEYEGDLATQMAVRDALRELPVRQRSVLILRYYARLKYHEISEELGMPVATVKSLTRRGLFRLQSALSEDKEADAHETVI